MVKEATRVGTRLVVAVVGLIMLVIVATITIGTDTEVDLVTATPKVYRVVVIDDDETTKFMNVEIIETFIEKPVAVVGYDSCAQAKAQEGSNQVDLAVIDGLQPKEYGPACADEVKTFWNASILCYSNEEAIVNACKGKGFQALLKTESLATFIWHVNSILESRP